MKYEQVLETVELEVSTADLWLSLKTIRVTEIGSENTYYVDQFNNRFFCKNYPWGFINGVLQTASQ